MPTVSERALRAAYDARHRRDDDYFEVAARLARATLAPAAEIHWTTTGAPMQGGRQLTACGEWVLQAHITGSPSCKACQQQQAIHDAADF